MKPRARSGELRSRARLKGMGPRARGRAGLLALTLAVIAAHVLLLRGLPDVTRLPERSVPRALVTRTVEPAPATALPGVAEPTPETRAAMPEGVSASRSARQDAAAQEPTNPQDAAFTLAAPTQASPPIAAPSTPAASAPVATPAPAASASPQPSAAFQVAAPVRLNYRVTAYARKLTLQGESELRWRHDGQSYEAGLEVSAPLLPTRRQTSTGSITADGLAPQRFSDKARNEEAAHFQRDKGLVTFSSNRPDAPLLAGAQDRLSVLLQLGAMIAGNPRKFPTSSIVAVQTASTRDAEEWQFTVEGEEQLQSPGGTVTALKLTRNPRKEFDQKVELWLAPGMDYVPVRLRLTQPNGDWVDQQWSSTDKG
jgi:hypothetical protein